MPEYRATANPTWGGFAVDARRAELLAGPTFLRVSDDEPRRIEMDTGYDPPGSAAAALAVTIVTAIVVAAVGTSGGGIVAPGWLVWYVIITFARRRRVTLDLTQSASVRVDDATRRLAFESAIDGRATWLAVEVKDDFAEASGEVRELMTSRVTDGRVGRGGVTAFVILAIVILVVVAVMVWAART